MYPPDNPPRRESNAIAIDLKDCYRLLSGEYLNDNIIDFFMKYLLDEKFKKERGRVYVFSNQFFTRLTSNIPDADILVDKSVQYLRHQKVDRWTKNVNLFDKDYILVPINQR